MRLKIILSLIGIALLIVSCFLPWLTFESRNLSFRGIDEMRLVLSPSKVVSWGKPGFFNLLWAAIFLIFLFLKTRWAMWAVLVAAGFNFAWSVRNFLLLSACSGGDCPVKEEGLYLLIIASLLLFFASFLSGKDANRA